jgi:hypothetical protein
MPTEAEMDKAFYVDAATNIFKCQKLNTTTMEHVTEAGANDPVIGIIQETVSSADATTHRLPRAANVRVAGVSRAIAAAGITVGARLVAGATGQVITALVTTAKQNQVGIALTPATNAGDHLDVLLTPGVQIDT